MRLLGAKVVFEASSGVRTVQVELRERTVTHPCRFSATVAGVTLVLQSQSQKSGVVWSADIVSAQKINVKEATLSWDISGRDYSRVFVNGIQSWTDSREFGVDECMLGLPPVFAPLYAKHKLEWYGDYTFHKYPSRPGCFHGYTYCYLREAALENDVRMFGSLSERAGYTVFDIDVKKNTMRVSKDCEGMVLTQQRRIFELYAGCGNETDVFDEYFACMHMPPLKAKPAAGWTSWYYHYTNISEEIILSNLRSFVENQIPIDVFQVDDGFQTAVGDWLSVNHKFPRGMAVVASEIAHAGFTPGLWLAPFICEKKSDLFKNHPDWILRNAKGEPVVAGNNDGWSGAFYVLDFYNAQVRDYLSRVFRTVLREWGFRMVKLDFLYAVALLPSRGKTRGEIMCEAMDFLREVCGDSLILGCGVPLGPSFGKVDYCRIGCDVGLGWDDAEPAMVHYRERISTITAITNSLGRRHLDGRAFWNDTDVFLLRTEQNSLTASQRYTLFLTNLITGNLLFTSDNIERYKLDDQNLMQIYLRQFPIAKRRIQKVSFQDDVYKWRNRSTIGQLFRGPHPYASVAVVEFTVQDISGKWKPHVAVLNLGGKSVEAKLPQGLWWHEQEKKPFQSTITLAPFESRCVTMEKPGPLRANHIFGREG